MAPPPPSAVGAGLQWLRQALPLDCIQRWRAAARQVGGASHRLADHDELAADALRALADSPLRRPIEQALGPSPRCNLSQSWLRHGRPPHQWHQDGALHFDFLAHPAPPLPAGALLEMLTCWIALTPCGADAPGLEWVDAALPGLLLPADLAAPAVAARFDPALLIRPELQAGDALLFDGAVLHRTHLTPAMQGERCSLEFRFFRAEAVPARVAGERLVDWPPAEAGRIDGG